VTPTCACTNSLNCDEHRCPSGCYSKPNAGSSVCLQAPAGTYSKCSDICNSSANVLESCPMGTFSRSLGATDNSTCRGCPAASYCPSQGMATPTLCEPGSFSHAEAAVVCTQCGAGTFAPGFGSTACDECSAGMFCPAGAIQQCRCPVDSYQDGARSSACKQCIGQADLVTDSAEEERFKNVCVSVIGVFATISLCYFVLTILLWRSRHLSKFRTNLTTACFYTTSFAVYALLKVFASHRMLQAPTQQEKLTAVLIMSCTFMLFFWLAVVGKMWLVQLWTLMLSDHVKADSRQAFMLTAHCAQIIERRIALAVCAVHCISFASFAGVFSAALGACAPMPIPPFAFRFLLVTCCRHAIGLFSWLVALLFMRDHFLRSLLLCFHSSRLCSTVWLALRSQVMFQIPTQPSCSAC
jgi:hypothetical protein